MYKAKKIMCLTLAIALLSSVFVGCGKKVDSNDGSQQTTTTDDKNSTQGEKITLTYWVPIHASATKIMKSYNESEMYQELEKRTGVHIEFIHPAAGQAKEQFNLMIASKDLPDIISQYTESYRGGVDKAIDDGMYLKLNDLVDKYAPNFKALRESNKEIARQTVTDSGNIWAFPCLQYTEEKPWWGMLIRKDWLDELGLKTPTTIDEWYSVLQAFKTKKGAEAPLIFPKEGYDFSGVFMGAYNIGYDFYKKDNSVQYAFTQPGYKDYLATMNKWYEEGLIDKDFPTRDDKSREAMITSSKAGAWIGAYEDISLYGDIIKTTNPKAEIVAAPYPSLNPGENVNYREKDEFNKGCNTVITTSCEKPEEAVKWLDYAYGDEGSMLFNWGILDKSYKMVDGKPQFTDLILKNPDGLSYSILGWKYKLHMGPYKRDWLAYPITDSIKGAMDVWGEAGTDYVMPPINLTDEENRKYSPIMTEVNTFKDEKTLKFILGAESLDKFDDYVKQINKMKIDEATKIKQAALERYNKR